MQSRLLKSLVRLLQSLVVGFLLVVPTFARADTDSGNFALRAAYLVPMYVNSGQPNNGLPGANAYTYGVGDKWLSNLDVLASWYPVSFLSLDVEGQFNLSSPSASYPMTGIYVGPGVTLDLPLFLYARVSLPIQVSGDQYTGGSLSKPTLFLRAGGGLKLELFVLRLYLEVTADFAYAGSNVSFFASQTINLAAGVWVRF
jgi:hypothetical protein